MLVLRNGGFARLWIGQFLSLFADWALRALLLLWVYRLTHSGVGTSLVGLAEALPLLLLSPVAGALVDRWHRGHTMAVAVLARAALVLPLFLVTDRAQLPLIVLVTLLVNAAAQFFGPAAAACTPVVVGQEQLGQANSLLSLLQSTVGLLAPAGGALLFARLGAHGAVALLGLLYLARGPGAGHRPRAASGGRRDRGRLARGGDRRRPDLRAPARPAREPVLGGLRVLPGRGRADRARRRLHQPRAAPALREGRPALPGQWRGRLCGEHADAGGRDAHRPALPPVRALAGAGQRGRAAGLCAGAIAAVWPWWPWARWGSASASASSPSSR